MSRPNFHIIEGEYEDIDYESFKKDYLNQFIPKSEILEKYDLTHNRYLKYGKRVFEETGFKRSRGVTPTSRGTNIRTTREGRYRVDKQINGRKLYCGTYESMDKARRVRDFLIKHNWSNNAIEYCMSGRSV